MRIISPRNDYTSVDLPPFKYSEVESKSSPAFPKQKTLLVPIVTIHFPLADRTLVGYECIVDSGSTFCYFHGEIGRDILGLNIEEGKKLSDVKGVVGSFDAYFHTIRFMLKGWGIDEAYVGFSDELKSRWGILGQHSFFEIFNISFDRLSETFNLKSAVALKKGKIEPYEVTEALKIRREKKTEMRAS